MPKKLIIMRGPSGSGKSEVAKNFAKLYEAPICSSDHYFTDVDGKYNFDMNKLKNAHDYCKQVVEEYMNMDKPVIIIDNTNIRFKEMKHYILLAYHYGYNIIEFAEPDWHPNLKTTEGKWNLEFLLEQQQNKNRQDINKSVNPDVVKRMVDCYEYEPTVEKILQGENF
jgi:adenylate kinase family enzyme